MTSHCRRMPFRSTSLLLLLLLPSFILSIHAASTYRAAAVEHDLVIASTPLETFQTNLNFLEQDVALAAENKVELLVYPEFILGSVLNKEKADMVPYCFPIPAASESLIPCDDAQTFSERPVLYRVSCMAKQYNMSISVNTCDLNATSSASGQPIIYNTEVVFNNQGALIARYHKYHVYFTKIFDIPPIIEHITFSLDIGDSGVTFGLFVCKDILFHSPAVDLVDAGIRHFPYSVDLDVALLAPETFQAWSLLHSSTIIAANPGKEKSGIFSKGKNLTPADQGLVCGNDKLFIADVPV